MGEVNYNLEDKEDVDLTLEEDSAPALLPPVQDPRHSKHFLLRTADVLELLYGDA
jgi:hypothetical protein